MPVKKTNQPDPLPIREIDAELHLARIGGGRGNNYLGVSIEGSTPGRMTLED